ALAQELQALPAKLKCPHQALRLVDANREPAETLRRAIRAYSENEPPETQNPPQGAGSVSRQAGEYRSVATPIFPENLNRCKPFFGDGGALSQSSPVYRRVAETRT